jgi:hypothetical protein
VKAIRLDTLEARIISWAVTGLIVLALVCVAIFIIGLLVFGLAQLSAHTP